jgi:hypothetical protein
MPPAPGNAELMRRLDELVTEFRALRVALETGYVRKDVYAADRQADAIQIKGLEDEHHVFDKRIDLVNTKIVKITEQRDSERDERDRQRTSDRRLIYTVAVTALFGPLFVAWILHMTGAQ